MALIFMDGFDAGDAGAKWVASSAGSSTATRFGVGSCLSLSGSSSPAGSVYKVLPSSYSTVFVGFAYKQSNNGDPGTFMSLLDSGGVVRLNANISMPELSVSANSMNVSSTGANIQLGKWDYIEIGVTFGTSGNIVIRRNGVTVASATGDSGNVTINRIRLSGVSFWPNVQFDDLYVLDSTGGSPNNNFLGDVRVYTSTPSGAGNSTQLTASTGANYTTVDELPYSASDYVKGSTAGLKDTYAMSDLPPEVTTIYGLQNNIIAKKTDAGSISVKPVIRSGGTDYAGPATVMSLNDATLSAMQTVDPATSTAWTQSGVNNMESGVELA